MTEKRQNKLTLFFLLLLILSAVLRVILSIFPKAAVTYNDELFYLELSQNIFLRGSLNVYGTPIGEEYLVSRGEEAANFFQVTDPSVQHRRALQFVNGFWAFAGMEVT